MSGGGGTLSTGGVSSTGGAPATGGAAAIGGAGTGNATGGAGVTATGGAAPSTDAGQPDQRILDAASSGDAGAIKPDAGGAVDSSIMKRPACPAGPFPAPTVQSTKTVCANFAFNYGFNEGPTWVAAQNAFFFSNFVIHSPTGGDMIKYTPGGECEVFLKDVGCNGLAATPDGNLVGACQQARAIIRFDLTTKQQTIVADSYMGMMFDSPNDSVVHSSGTIYFSNTTTELGTRPPGVGLAAFSIDPTGVVSLISKAPANGIALSPDEKKLYVLGGGTWDVDAMGGLSKPASLFTAGDGMAVDCAGNLYLFGSIYTPQGQRLGTYANPGGTNLAFGGADGKTLLVVGTGPQVREVQMNLPGMP
jgi:gluconolactonase